MWVWAVMASYIGNITRRTACWHFQRDCVIKTMIHSIIFRIITINNFIIWLNNTVNTVIGRTWTRNFNSSEILPNMVCGNLCRYILYQASVIMISDFEQCDWKYWGIDIGFTFYMTKIKTVGDVLSWQYKEVGMDRIGGNKGYNISVIAIIDFMLRIPFHSKEYVYGTM